MITRMPPYNVFEELPKIANQVREISEDLGAELDFAVEAMQTTFDLAIQKASTARTDGWVSVANGLPDDDSDVYAAIAWTHSPGVRKYVIHDCSYYEGGTGSGQKIFADCEGEEFEAKDVDFWIYKYRLAEQLPVPQAEPPKER